MFINVVYENRPIPAMQKSMTNIVATIGPYDSVADAVNDQLRLIDNYRSDCMSMGVSAMRLTNPLKV